MVLEKSLCKYTLISISCTFQNVYLAQNIHNDIFAMTMLIFTKFIELLYVHMMGSYVMRTLVHDI